MSTFSVIIPTYQRPEELAVCLNCLAPGTQQLSFNDYEVIVSDDAGTGSETQRLVVERYPWATWVEGPSHGVAANRNHGARQARGEWLVFTDDDCRPVEGWLDAYRSAQENTSQQVMEGKTEPESEKPGPGWTAPINRKGGKLWSCNFAIRRSLYEKLGGFDENYPSFGVEDIDFRVRVHAEIDTVQFISDAKVVHPWRKSRPLISQIGKGRSWQRFFQKYPEKAHAYNLNFHLGAVLEFVAWLPLSAFREEWRLEAGVKTKNLMKSIAILRSRFRRGYQQ